MAERYASPSHKRDLLNAMIASKGSDGVSVHQDQVRGEVIATLVAGGDTTAMSILGCVGYLLQNSDVMAKLRAEFAHARTRENLGQGIPKFQQLQKFPYLEAVMLETLRLSPSMWGTFTRQVSVGGAEIRPGEFIPGGTVVGVNNWVFGRNKLIYGPDPDEFKPQRWL
jgi:cytochrome P450